MSGRAKRRRIQQRWGKLDVQKALAKTGIEFHWPGYQYMGPGTHLAKRLKRGDPGKNRLDRKAIYMNGTPKPLNCDYYL